MFEIKIKEMLHLNKMLGISNQYYLYKLYKNETSKHFLSN